MTEDSLSGTRRQTAEEAEALLCAEIMRRDPSTDGQQALETTEALLRQIPDRDDPLLRRLVLDYRSALIREARERLEDAITDSFPGISDSDRDHKVDDFARQPQGHDGELGAAAVAYAQVLAYYRVATATVGHGGPAG